MNRITGQRLALYVLLGIFFIVGSIVSVRTGLILDDPTEQQTFHRITDATKSLLSGDLNGFKQLESYDQRYYGIGFYLAAYPLQRFLQPYVARNFNVDDETALLLARRPAVFLLFVISVVIFYRLVRFFIREPSIAVAVSAAYAMYPYLFGHAMINIKDSPFMSMYLICTYFSLRLVKHYLQTEAPSIRAKIAGLGCATAALASIRIPGLMILVQYAFTFALTDWSRSSAEKSVSTILRWRNVACFAGALIPLVLLAYPAVWLNPVQNVFAALKFMGWLPQPGCTLTWGQCMPPFATPSYVAGWMAVKLPALVLIGIVFVPFALKETWRDHFQRIAYLSLLFGSLYVLIAIVAFRARLYDETRQILFVYPLFFLLGSLAIYFVSRQLLLAIGLFSFVIFISDQLQLHPYQYVYFNEIARFLKVDELFETDYWGTSGREHAELLARNLNRFDGSECILTDLPHLYRPFIDPRTCVEPLDGLTEYPDKNYLIAITCSPSRFGSPPNCRQLSASVTRTLWPSNHKITMAAAYSCSR